MMAGIPHAPVNFPWPTTEALIEGVRHNVKARILVGNGEGLNQGVWEKL